MGTGKPTVLLLMNCYMWNKLCLNQITGGVKGLMIVSEWPSERVSILMIARVSELRSERVF